MTVNVRDKDDGNTSDAIGSFTFFLSEVVTSRDRKKTFALKPKGEVSIAAENVGSKSIVKLDFRGSKLKNMDTFGKSDPFFKLSQLLPNGRKELLYQSEVIDNNLNPKWRTTTPFQADCSTQQPNVFFKCYDEDTIGSEGMGYFTTSMAELIQAPQTKKEFKLVDPKKKNKWFGDIYVDAAHVEPCPSFVDFLQCGWQINLVVSLDFTASNGSPRSPSSLHNMNPQVFNPYKQVLCAVGSVLMPYDVDQNIPFFGFGASINRQTQHFFHINQQSNPYVTGIEGMLAAYDQFLPTAQLSGPTNFAPTIKNVTAGARSSEANRVYSVLLIVTDGDITDMTETIAALVEADDAPLSVIIVGVGSSSFDSMQNLDADGTFLRSGPRQSRRDIVQFVPFSSYAGAPARLAADVLREVPTQFEKYAMLRGIKPVPPS